MSGETMIAMSTAVYNRFFKAYKDIREDLINEGVLGIVKGLEYFDESRGALATFVWVCAKQYMLIYIKKEIKHRNIIAKDDVSDFINYIPDESAILEVPYDGKKEVEKLYSIADEFTGRRKDIAYDLISGKAPKELVEKYGLTKQRISQVYIGLKNKVLEKYDFDDGYLVEKNND